MRWGCGKMSDITYVKERPQNATATIKGIVRLAGDLGGTADAPTVVHISPAVTVGLVSGGTGADLSATGPGLLVQATTGENVTLVSTSSGLRGVISDETGTGALVFATTPTLVTPVLGEATATSINKVALTAPATSATLTIADGKTLTVNDTMTLVGAFTLTIGSNSTVNGSLVGNISGGGTVATGGETLTVGATSSINQDVSTAGSPSFAGLTVDTDTLKVDPTNNRVGVVVGSPTAPMEVYGAATVPANSGTTTTSIFRVGNSYVAGVQNTLDIGRYSAVPYGIWVQTYDAADLGAHTQVPLVLQPVGGSVVIGTTTDNGYRFDIDTGAMRLAEMTAPAAPAANGVVIYAQDNGAGKTQLMALFSSGAAQQIAIQP